jgi:NIMA (never in mitosis gene a)-related kinase
MAEYEEIQCIGRGNFGMNIYTNQALIGAAYLVKNKVENKEYIAKKILLGSLEMKEQEGALMEVQLLKNLNHPNIVSYKTSFISHGLLIIVMEYCEGKT